MFYTKLALTNLKKNGKAYFPYLFTCVITVVMFYVMYAIGLNKGLDEMSGAGALKTILMWSTVITAIFSAVFLFYTNSFLVKQRKKEFGLYQVLGMDKMNLTKMMAWESTITAAASIIAGVLLGILLGRLMFLILLKMIHFSVPLKFAVEPKAVFGTIILFMAIFVVTYVSNLLQVQKANPVDLLHGQNQGEREPRTKWLLTLVGILCLGGGYYIAQTTESPLAAISQFFIAVILVIIGTYALFTAGSIALLKYLKKKKTFYYQTRHFTSISGMIYRMKQNAVGLSNICIMSTVVLVLLSVSVSLYAGMEDVMKIGFPMDFRAQTYNIEQENITKERQIIDEETRKAGVDVIDRISYRAGIFTGVWNKEVNQMQFMGISADMSDASKEYRSVELIPLSDYNEMEQSDLTLKTGEVFVYMPGENLDTSHIQLNDRDYQVKHILKNMKLEKRNNSAVIKTVYVIMENIEEIKGLREQLKDKDAPGMQYTDMFNLKGNEKETLNAMESMKERMSNEVPEGYADSRQAISQEFYAVYGGFLFLGIFVGSLFLMATVLIIYYKQISEGYDDRSRYQIMQKVGMSHKEVKSSIRSQVLTVFFLPLGAAVLHVAVAFKAVTKLLAVMNLVNVQLFFMCTLGTIVIFAVFYAGVFGITSREYYKIVD
jgi:putative ABC transport system permease protein